jgi:hypothetical protein
MTQTALVAAIVSLFNSSRFIREAIDSILSVPVNPSAPASFCEYDVAKTPPVCIEFGIPEHLRSRGTTVMLTLEITNPMIQSRDARALGFLLQRIEISNSGGALFTSSSPCGNSLLPQPRRAEG